MGPFKPSRRQLLASAGLVGAGALLPSALASAAGQPDLAQQAVIWGVPLVLSGRYIALAREGGFEFNRFYVSPNLSTPATRAAGPNIDTLYGLGWLDLAAGPQVIAVPDTADRYYSLQLLDLYGDSFAYIGRRATGTKAGAYAIAAPGWTGALPTGVTRIDAPTSKLLVLVRTLVRGTTDLADARAIHTSYSTGPLADWPNGRQPSVVRGESLNVLPQLDLSDAGAAYFEELGTLAREYPPLPADAINLASFQSLNLPHPRPALAASVSPAIAKVRERGASAGKTINGWHSNLEIVPFIRDPLARAANNLYGPGAHINVEALYFGARQGSDGKPLNGANRYRLRFAPGRTPPVDAFWSIILYDSNFFLFDNPGNRYGINDRSEGLVYEPDGSLEILICADRPQAQVNWLPAPRGDFQLITRFYQPRAEVLDGSYRLPPLERLS